VSQPNSPHFHAGKEARHQGKPCIIRDGRMSPTSRQEWRDGWNFQDCLMRPAPFTEEIQQNDEFFAGLKAELKKL
jgi:hypothetical protein